MKPTISNAVAIGAVLAMKPAELQQLLVGDDFRLPRGIGVVVKLVRIIEKVAQLDAAD